MQWIVLKNSKKQYLLKVGVTLVTVDENISPKADYKFLMDTDTNQQVVMFHPFTLKRFFQNYHRSKIEHMIIPRTPHYNGNKCLVIDEADFLAFIK